MINDKAKDNQKTADNDANRENHQDFEKLFLKSSSVHAFHLFFARRNTRTPKKLNSKTTKKRIKATSMRADSYRGMDISSPYFEAINDASVSPGENIDEGIRGMPPTTILTAIVSPNARPNPSNIAANMFGPEARKTTFFTVSHFVAPTERDASLRARGIALNDSIQREMIIGKTMIARVIAAVKMHRPVL